MADHMLKRNMRGRKAISVMFMTFIAISILTAVFLTMYLYLLRAQTLATDAERLYAEAAQEKLEVYLDKLADDGNGEVLVENVGGIGVVVKYVVELDWGGKTAKMCEIGEAVPVDSSLVIKLSQCSDTISPDGDLYILTERGNMFKAIRGGMSFELEVSPVAATIESGGELLVSLKLKAVILETPSNGTILVVADTSGCRMQAMKEIISGETVTTMTAVTSITVKKWWRFVTEVIPYYGTLTAVASPTTATVRIEQEFIEEPSPMTFTFTTRTTKTINTTITLTARDIEPWINASQCYVWFKILNATSGIRLAEAGLQVMAGSLTTTTTTTTTTETTTGTTTTTTTGKSFSLSLNPSEVRIPVGGIGFVRVTVRAERPDYEGRVRLLVENPPRGFWFRFNPERVNVSPDKPGESILTIVVGRGVIPGKYVVRIVGVDVDTGERSEPAILTIWVEPSLIPPIPPPEPA